MFLSLPLVQEQERYHEVTLIRENDPDTPVKYGISVPKCSTILHLKEALGEKCNISPERLVLADIDRHRILNILADNRPFDQAIGSLDVTIAYEVAAPKPGLISARIVHRKEKKRVYSRDRLELFGVPFIIFFTPKEITGKQLYNMVWNCVKRFILTKSEVENVESMDTSNDDMEVDGSEDNTLTRSKQPLNFEALPFKLSLVNAYGTRCGRCDTTSHCTGCSFKASDKPLKLKAKSCTIAIDWNPDITKKYYDEEEALSVRLNASVTEHRQQKKKNFN